MPVTDLKVSLRKRGATDFAGDGQRLLPITKKEYVLGLLGADGRLDPSLVPAWLYSARNYLGILDLDEQSTIDIDDIVTANWAAADESAQGSYLEVTNAGWLPNGSANAANYEIIGAGDEGDRTFPIHLEVGDYLVLAKFNASAPEYSFAIVNNSHGIADTIQYGITKLYDGVDSASSVLAATANAVKTAYDLAFGKEPAIGAKGTAFNKDFGTGAGTVAEGDHEHSSFDRGATEFGGNVLKTLEITNGVITALTTQSISDIASGAGLVVSTDLDLYTTLADFNSYVTTNDSAVSAVNALAVIARKQGLEYYDSVANADGGSHNAGDIVAVLEA